MNNKSKIKAKRSIPWGQVLLINELIANPQVVKQMEDGIKANNPNIKTEDLQQQVYQLVLRDNYFNKIMDLISKSYDFDLDQTELKLKAEKLLKNNKEMDKKMADQIVLLNTIREIIYEDLAKELKISVSDDHVKQTLENYYKQTGQPIRDFLANRSKFEEVKRTLLDQQISERIMNAFKPDFQLEDFNKRMREQSEKQNQKASTKPSV